jgi:hypothetical protein
VQLVQSEQLAFKVFQEHLPGKAQLEQQVLLD